MVMNQSSFRPRMSNCTLVGAHFLWWVTALFVLIQICIAGVESKEDVNISRHQNAGEGEGIYWDNLGVVTSADEKHDNLPSNGHSVILYPSTGHVQNGNLCGIIGPSGAGKSTLLAALAGTTSKSAALRVQGSVWYQHANHTDENQNVNTTSEDPTPVSSKSVHIAQLSIRRGEIAFLQQHDVFFSMLTTRETLDLAAFLELPKLTATERKDVVDRCIDALGLTSVQHHKIGERSAGVHGNAGGGLSGGERRRLSVALELISTPRLFLADEPTTGLDSSQAEKVIRLISRLARDRNIPSLCTLHQPRASIWRRFDSFILLAPGGKVCYTGDRRKAKSYFAHIGYKCPEETNPAEFFIDLVSIDTEDPVQAQKDFERIDHLFEEFNKHIEAKQRGQSSHLFHHSRLPISEVRPTSVSSRKKTRNRTPSLRFVRRWAALFRRSWRQNVRDKRVNALRLIASIGQSILFSSIFKTIQKGVPTSRSIADRTALVSFAAINMSMMALMKTIDLFSREKGVIVREQTRQQYTNFEYLLSKAVSEIPLDASFAAVFTTVLKATTGLRIPLSQLTLSFCLMTVAGASLGFAVGGVTPNSEAAMTLGVPLLVIFMVVGIINPSGVDKSMPPPPVIVQWLKVISPIRWAIESLCVGEFEGMEFEDAVRRKKKPWFLTSWQTIRDLPKMGAFVMVQNGDQVLNALGLEGLRYSDLTKNIVYLSGAYLTVSWLGLHFGQNGFVEAEGNNPVQTRDDVVSQHRTSQLQAGVSQSIKVPIVRKVV